MFSLRASAARLIAASSLVFGVLSPVQAGAPLPPALRAATVQAAPEVLDFAAKVIAAQNSDGKPFAVIDKPNAAVSMFDEQGRLLGTAPVLLGLSKGDDSVPGIGERPMRLIKPDERTTPAGRFAAQPGHDPARKDLIWLDYDAAVAMHRVVTQVKAERRLERLASPAIEDNRVSYGCINVPADYYDALVKPNLSDRAGFIYVLPDSKPMAQVFDFLQPGAASKASAKAPLSSGNPEQAAD